MLGQLNNILKILQVTFYQKKKDNRERRRNRYRTWDVSRITLFGNRSYSNI